MNLKYLCMFAIVGMPCLAQESTAHRTNFSETVVETKTATETEIDAETGAVTKTMTVTKTETDVETGTVTRKTTKTVTETETEIDAETGAVTKTVTETDVETGTVTVTKCVKTETTYEDDGEGEAGSNAPDGLRDPRGGGRATGIIGTVKTTKTRSRCTTQTQHRED